MCKGQGAGLDRQVTKVILFGYYTAVIIYFRCMTGYDAEEVTALTSAVNNTASTLCLAKSFNDKCGEFVKTKILTDGDAGTDLAVSYHIFYLMYFQGPPSIPLILQLLLLVQLSHPLKHLQNKMSLLCVQVKVFNYHKNDRNIIQEFSLSLIFFKFEKYFLQIYLVLSRP